MLEKKGLWYVLMFGALVLWVVVILLGLILFPDNNAGKAVLPAALLILHCAEIPISLKVGAAKGLPSSRVIVNTALYGFTWWLPLKKGVFDK